MGEYAAQWSVYCHVLCPTNISIRTMTNFFLPLLTVILLLPGIVRADAPVAAVRYQGLSTAVQQMLPREAVAELRAVSGAN